MCVNAYVCVHVHKWVYMCAVYIYVLCVHMCGMCIYVLMCGVDGGVYVYACAHMCLRVCACVCASVYVC